MYIHQLLCNVVASLFLSKWEFIQHKETKFFKICFKRSLTILEDSKLHFKDFEDTNGLEIIMN